MMTIVKMLYSVLSTLLKITWRIIKVLCKPMWDSIKDTSKASWELYKAKKAQKAACDDNSAERESLSAEGTNETKDDIGDSESSDSKAQS